MSYKQRCELKRLLIEGKKHYFFEIFLLSYLLTNRHHTFTVSPLPGLLLYEVKSYLERPKPA